MLTGSLRFWAVPGMGQNFREPPVRMGLGEAFDSNESVEGMNRSEVNVLQESKGNLRTLDRAGSHHLAAVRARHWWDAPLC